MPTISEIVNVNISRDTTAVQRAAFGVMMHLSLTRVFDSGELWREYTSAAALLTDGFKTTDTAYLAAVSLFSQEVAPEKMIVGQRATDDTVTVTPTAVNTYEYSVTINGTEFSFTSDGTATVAEVVAGLVAAINAGSEPVTATDSTTHVTLAPDVASTYYSVTAGNNLALGFTASDTFAEDITAIRTQNDTWYALTAHTHTAADVEDIAAHVETLKKIYGTSASTAAIITSATTDIASVLKDAGYDRTFVMYSGDAAEFPEAGILGVMLPKEVGSATWKFKTITGITADDLTSTQSTYARNKNCMTYETIGGVSITREGKVASGEFIDTIIGVDWLESRMEERVYSRLVNSDKIPYTDDGFTMIEGDIRAQLQEAIDVGFLAASPAPTVTVPKVANVSSALKTARETPAITFTGTLAGAVHKVTITGSVTV